MEENGCTFSCYYYLDSACQWTKNIPMVYEVSLNRDNNFFILLTLGCSLQIRQKNCFSKIGCILIFSRTTSKKFINCKSFNHETVHMPCVRKGTYVFCTIKKLCVENMAVSCGLGKHYNIKCPPPPVNPYDVLTN